MKSVLFAVLLLSFSPQSFASGSPIVTVIQGTLKGKTVQGVNIFLGIPYAAPPIGELRWQPPRPALKWDGVKSARAHGSECVQPALVGERQLRGSEDCLNLDVWSTDLHAKKPVMVFIHGGAFVDGNAEGESFFPLYGSKYLSRQGDVVVVSINYRMGAFGFLALPELENENPEQALGNYGLLDQVAALKWIKENIGQFGGDPEAVTVFGQSAGAASVLLLMTNPLAKGLFQGAIVESGYLGQNPALVEIARSQTLATDVGCMRGSKADIQCLRSLNPRKILNAHSFSEPRYSNKFMPNVDGKIFQHGIIETFQLGLQNRVPMIIGTNRDETKSVAHMIFGPTAHNDDALKRMIVTATQNLHGGGEAFWKTVSLRYNSANFDGNAQNALISLTTDAVFTCPTRKIARLASLAGQNVWRYVYTHDDSDFILFGGGAGHARELPYVFHMTPFYLGFTNADRKFSDVIEGYWTRFAKSQESPWPAYSQQEQYLNLNDSPVVESRFRNQECDFLDSALGISP